MNISSIDPDSVKANVKIAFASIKCPPDEQLLRPGCEGDSLEIKDFLSKNWEDWSNIPKEIIERNYCSLPFFSKSALLFVLPAYICAGLDDLGNNVAVFTAYRLDPMSDSDFFVSWTSSLTMEQKTAVSLFLKCANDLDSASESLENYWNEFIKNN
jgi:hypothetical protein